MEEELRKNVIKAFWQLELYAGDNPPTRIGDYTPTRRDWELLDRIDRDGERRFQQFTSILYRCRPNRSRLIGSIDPSRILNYLSSSGGRPINRQVFEPLHNAIVAFQENDRIPNSIIDNYAPSFSSGGPINRQVFTSIAGVQDIPMLQNNIEIELMGYGPRRNPHVVAEEEDNDSVSEEESEDDLEGATRETLVNVRDTTRGFMDKLDDLKETMEENTYIVLSNELQKIWDSCAE